MDDHECFVNTMNDRITPTMTEWDRAVRELSTTLASEFGR